MGKDDRSGGLRQIALAGPRAGGLVVKGPQGSRNLVVLGIVCGAVFRGRDCQVRLTRIVPATMPSFNSFRVTGRTCKQRTLRGRHVLSPALKAMLYSTMAIVSNAKSAGSGAPNGSSHSKPASRPLTLSTRSASFGCWLGAYALTGRGNSAEFQERAPAVVQLQCAA